jgi:hypothetical protein
LASDYILERIVVAKIGKKQQLEAAKIVVKHVIAGRAGLIQ